MAESSNKVVISQQKSAMSQPISKEKPKFPQYADKAKRMESFDSWPEYIPVKKDDLVEAGLVYTGVGDSVRCYFCGGGLRNWEQGDEPMEEHGKWYPKCQHILSVKGLEKPLQAGEKPEKQLTEQTDSACAAPNHLESVAAQSCIENGYSNEMVQKAIDVFIERHGNSDFKGAHLCQILLHLEEEEPQHPSLTVSDNVVDSRGDISTEEEEMEPTRQSKEPLVREETKLPHNEEYTIVIPPMPDHEQPILPNLTTRTEGGCHSIIAGLFCLKKGGE